MESDETGKGRGEPGGSGTSMDHEGREYEELSEMSLLSVIERSGGYGMESRMNAQQGKGKSKMSIKQAGGSTGSIEDVEPEVIVQSGGSGTSAQFKGAKVIEQWEEYLMNFTPLEKSSSIIVQPVGGGPGMTEQQPVGQSEEIVRWEERTMSIRSEEPRKSGVQPGKHQESTVASAKKARVISPSNNQYRQVESLKLIQLIPGDTPSDKFKSLEMEAKKLLNNDEAASIFVSRNTSLYLKIATARHDANCSEFLDALTSNDPTLIKRALKLDRCIFRKINDFLNYAYLSESIFPHLSVFTRSLLVKKIASFLYRNDSCIKRHNFSFSSEFNRTQCAERLFDSLADNHGNELAIPLMTVCSPQFNLEAVNKRGIRIPEKILRLIFRKNSNFVLDYLRLSKPSERTPQPIKISIHDYKDFLKKIVKKHLGLFTELMLINEGDPPKIKLSISSSRFLIKNSPRVIHLHPNLFVPIVNLKCIPLLDMDEILPKLCPSSPSNFDTDRMLSYLEYYSDDAKVALLKNTYKKVYERELLDDKKHVTLNLIRILPLHEREEQADIKINEFHASEMFYHYKSIPWCYLSFARAFGFILSEVQEASNPSERAAKFQQFLYNCKINNDHDSLTAVLTYYNKRHKNETVDFHARVLGCLRELFDLNLLKRQHWINIYQILNTMYSRDDACIEHNGIELLQGMLRYLYRIEGYIVHDLLNMYVSVVVRAPRDYYNPDKWNLMQESPSLEREIIQRIVLIAMKKYEDIDDILMDYVGNDPWRRKKLIILDELIGAMYNYNKRHCKGSTSFVVNSSRVSSLSIRQFDWLAQILRTLMRERGNCRRSRTVKSIIKKILDNEEYLYFEWSATNFFLQDIQLEHLPRLLKKNPQKFHESWNEFFQICKLSLDYKNPTNIKVFQRFVRSLRWYGHIPIKFAEQSLLELNEKKSVESVWILAGLCYGSDFCQVFSSFILDAIESCSATTTTTTTTPDEAKREYEFLLSVLRASRFTFRPEAFRIITKFLQSDIKASFLPECAKVAISMARATPSWQVVDFAKCFINKNTTLRKVSCKLLCLVSTYRESMRALQNQWKSMELDSTAKAKIFNKMHEMFKRNPCDWTWSTVKEATDTLSESNIKISFMAFSLRGVTVPFLSKYVETVVGKIAELTDKDDIKIEKYQCSIERFLREIDVQTCHAISADVLATIFKIFFFSSSPNIGSHVREVAVRYVLSDESSMNANLRFIIDIVERAVEEKWNCPHPKRPHFYPVNYGYRRFTEKLVTECSKLLYSLPVILSLINDLDASNGWSRDLYSRFLLDLAKSFLLAKFETDSFATMVADRIEQLAGLINLDVIPILVRAFDHFLRTVVFPRYSSEKTFWSMLTVFLNRTDQTSIIFVARLLPQVREFQSVSNYVTCIDTLLARNNLAVTCLVYDQINSISFHEATDIVD